MPVLRNAIRFTAASAAMLLATASLPAAAAQSYSESYNQNYGPGFALPFPGCCTWAPNTIGWYWTPSQTFALQGIETILADVLNGVNDNFDLTVTLYTDRPAAGGTALASATFNPGAFYAADPSWHGNAFASPVDVTAGTAYFVGFSGWDNSTPPGSTDRGGINWVVQTGYPGNLPPDAQLLGQAYDGADFGALTGTPTGNTAAPVIKFVGVIGAVPEPGTWAMLGVGMLLVSLRRRRSA